MNFENQTLTGDVTLDGNVFRSCTFRDCTLHFHGGHVDIAGRNTYQGVVYQFHDEAERTVRLLAALYSHDGRSAMLEMLEQINAKRSEHIAVVALAGDSGK